ncbi:class F sortase [Microbacterium aurantiacum]|uniref:class F sortase n=1 Tax=Microbacterium aurantiacum TaxID=162393 RepID=UPI001E507DFF|nr:class F sortase [Microbacterium chocolatum]
MTASPSSPGRSAHMRGAPRRGRARGVAITAAVLLSITLTSCATGEMTDAASAPPATVSASPAPSPPATPAPAPSPSAEQPPPTQVTIPAIELDEPLIDLGLQADGSMEVPVDFDDVGWYTPGGRPGGRGPVVIAGHVDSPTGPAVFLRLKELVPGDTVTVTAADGTPHDYVVTEVRDVAKNAFPTAEVFGATATDTLRLITCGGLFDTAAASYTDNRVVFAERL